MPRSVLDLSRRESTITGADRRCQADLPTATVGETGLRSGLVLFSEIVYFKWKRFQLRETRVAYSSISPLCRYLR